MTTTNPTVLRIRAEALIAFLTFPEAIAKLGSTVCNMERMMLQMSIGNLDTCEYTQERLETQIERIQKKLEGAE